jgi:hypothetical protein
MLVDICGELAPETLWHGSTTEVLPETLLSAADNQRWWNVIDHETFLDPQMEENDEDQRAELLSEVRTAYGNAVYEAFRTSSDQTLKAMAEEFGLDGLGNAVSIIFVTGISSYAERYGAAIEIDLEAEGLLAAIPDDNLAAEKQSWLLVLKAGSPFPRLSSPEFKL